jgi:acyl-CoA reductase-like NAD-dependent aldehyde dehydrogenase
MSSPRFPEPPPAVPPTPLTDVDRAIDALEKRKDAWANTSVARRIALLEECVVATVDDAEAWVRSACRAKGIQPGERAEGEEWLGGPLTTLRNMRLFIDALHDRGAPRPPRMETRDDGQVVAQVFPRNTLEKLMYGAITAEVWIEKGKPPSQGHIYVDRRDDGSRKGKVGLVLGAGNVASIGPMDALYKLFVDDEVVIIKTNPVNAYLGPHWEKSLAPLIREGFVAIVHGGAEVGAHIVNHAKVDTLHMTGSDKTHDAIVYGADPDDQKRRKANDDALVNKPMSSELGAVTPVLCVPGPWSDKELAFQARHVASMVVNNGSFNCNAAKALVVAKGWPLKERFVSLVRDALRRAPPRKAYYPGAQDRYRAFLDRYPSAEALQDPSDGVVPWTVIPNVPATAGEYALTSEAFCGVLAEVELDADDAKSFIEKALPFANDTMWGSLSCMILIHPTTEREYRAEFDQLLANLRYGGIGVNAWAGLIYALVVTTWGAFPGHPRNDIQSGRGVVHNAFMFDHPEKSIVRAPFHIKPTPLWFYDHQQLVATCRALLQMEAHPGYLKLPRLISNALRG